MELTWIEELRNICGENIQTKLWKLIVKIYNICWFYCVKLHSFWKNYGNDVHAWAIYMIDMNDINFENDFSYVHSTILIKNELTDENPSLCTIKATSRSLPRFLWKRIMHYLEATDTDVDQSRALLESLYGTGMRVSECTGLKWEM